MEVLAGLQATQRFFPAWVELAERLEGFVGWRTRMERGLRHLLTLTPA